MGKLNSNSLRVAFLHMAPHYNDVEHNVNLLEKLFRQAASLQPDLVLTPELAVSGYEFYHARGKSWIQTDSQVILDQFSNLATQYQTALLLGMPVYDSRNETFSNAAILIDENGRVTGIHRKVLVLPGSIERWASPGSEARPVQWRGYKAGLMICADAYSPRLAGELAERGAQVFISLAAWGPGEHAPDGEWEQRSLETGLPVLVCNRTGRDASLNFEGSSSVVVVKGKRVAEYAETLPVILTMDFDESWQPLSTSFSIYPIEREL